MSNKISFKDLNQNVQAAMSEYYGAPSESSAAKAIAELDKIKSHIDAEGHPMIEAAKQKIQDEWKARAIAQKTKEVEDSDSYSDDYSF